MPSLSCHKCGTITFEMATNSKNDRPYLICVNCKATYTLRQTIKATQEPQ